MLEAQSLRIGPATRQEGSDTSTVYSGDAAVGRIVERQIPWLPWRIRWTIAAHEGRDDAAVFLGRRAGWLSGNWDVYESDGTRVALLRGGYLLGGDGSIVGRVIGESSGGKIVDSSGVALGRWRRDSAGTMVHFGERSLGEPFLRMAILMASVGTQ